MRPWCCSRRPVRTIGAIDDAPEPGGSPSFIFSRVRGEGKSAGADALGSEIKNHSRSQPIVCNFTLVLRFGTRLKSCRTCMLSESRIFTRRRFCKPDQEARTATTSSTTTLSIRRSAPRADYEALCDLLGQRGMGQIIDVVPNHMGISGNANAWWSDVLRTGLRPRTPSSSISPGIFAAAGDAREVCSPRLGKPYGEALESAGRAALRVRAGLHRSLFRSRFPHRPRHLR